ncbi:septum formation protein Maf [Acidihalobacter aeolianus]|uniref:dTTP/UTP pyrophosphatase n=1 Tax=Acidihalobacter aeolianus TaxID=2792603 RepID=A0A1D8K991_9GAMM|nr:Maf family protein [Acidihalobacter aeolianus]AOV17548.1 septum formation protein Maf [Acidihalobacter aeolianus]
MVFDARLLLASASPRRRELLDQIGVSYRVEPVDVDETPRPGERPADYVRRVAMDKARAGWARNNGELAALGADTTVLLDDEILGKPVSSAAAAAMLGSLSGRTHQVCSAVALVQGTRERVVLSESRVSLRVMGEEEIARYVATGEPMDKAGAYAIQGLGAVFVAHLSGSYSGVMGLPLYETVALLHEFGIGTPLTRGQVRDGAA